MGSFVSVTGYTLSKNESFESGGAMKTIVRKQYMDRIIDLKDTPDIKRNKARKKGYIHFADISFLFA